MTNTQITPTTNNNKINALIVKIPFVMNGGELEGFGEVSLNRFEQDFLRTLPYSSNGAGRSYKEGNVSVLFRLGTKRSTSHICRINYYDPTIELAREQEFKEGFADFMAMG